MPDPVIPESATTPDSASPGEVAAQIRAVGPDPSQDTILAALDSAPAGSPAIEKAAQDTAAAIEASISDHSTTNIIGQALPLIADAPEVVKEAKAGYKTTEFWITLVTVLLAQLQVLHLPGHYGATIATVASVAAYALSRGVAKSGVPTVEPAPPVAGE